MNTFVFGRPNLFVKGVAELTFFDPSTGNIVGYDNVASETAITSSVNLQEIAGGFGNPLIGVIPDTSRLTGTYTSQAFSMEARQAISGGMLSYNGVTKVCETVTYTAGSLTVSKTPAKHYGQPESDTKGWCFVHESGESQYAGVNYNVDLETGKVVDFTGVNGKSYEVTYWTVNPSARVLSVPTSFNPTVLTAQIKYGVYAKQGNSIANGSLQGWLYVTVPQVVLNGNLGLDANQTANSTTDYAWMALSPDSNALTCDDCAAASDNYAYYVFVPCAGAASHIQALATVGTFPLVSVPAAGKTTTVPIPFKFVMDTNEVIQPDWSLVELKTQGLNGLTYDNKQGAVVISSSWSGNPTSMVFGVTGTDLMAGIRVTSFV